MYIKSRKMSKSKDLLFSECVGKLESWVVEDQETEYLSALKLAQILSELYSLGLQLPGPGTASTSSKEKEAMGESEMKEVLAAAQKLPIQYYHVALNPTDPSEENVGLGDLIDDVLDIYRDVVCANRQYASGNREIALWHWNFDMKTHWGDHATNALNALNNYLVREAGARVAGLMEP